ncbi:hypothetical protein [Lentzea cavernae]|uniref:Protein kinase domain-containing protein n=1 Tax=Lentzea cavernae TaxID=2020703 RepID=A0ABQ3MXF5_9PSEU|nr:hypothetical protein [Lentzea cavernae]GHH57955.1 hypothetical protein GCM10017774_78580 [Lentzea cavernae]
MTDPIQVQRTSLRTLSDGNFALGGQSSGLSWVHRSPGEVLLYKRYLPDTAQGASAEGLTAMAEWRRSLGFADRAFLDARTSWVRHVVMQGREVTGVLVPPAPDPFWRMHKDAPFPRDMAGLTLTAHDAKERGRDYSSIPQTIARLGHLLRTLSFLHINNVVVGDLRLQNTLASGISQTPATYLIDCDAMVLNGVSALRAAEAQTMRPDDVEGWPQLLDERTDCWKFASMSIACIGKDAALAAVVNDVRRHLTPDHSEVLEDFLLFENQHASARSLQAMADVWRGYVTGSGQEKTRVNSGLVLTPWLGAPSCAYEQEATSPVHSLQPHPPAPVSATPVWTRVTAPRQPTVSATPVWTRVPVPSRPTVTRPPTPPAPDPDERLRRASFWFVILVVAIGVLVGAALVAYELRR